MERLELLLAYLRRVLCFDFGSGQQYKEAAALLKEGGELHLGARLCVHQPPPEARMAPFASAPRLGPPAAAAFLDELLKLLAEFDRLDDEYEGLSNEAGEEFISKNCVRRSRASGAARSPASSSRSRCTCASTSRTSTPSGSSPPRPRRSARSTAATSSQRSR